TVALWDGIQYEQDGQTHPLKGVDVERIERDSRFLGPARRLLESGKYRAAEERFERIWKNNKGWEKAEAGYFLGRLHLLQGRPKDAMKAFDAYLDAHRDEKDWWVPPAVLGYAEAALTAGRGNTARSYFKELAGFGASWELRAKLGEGNALLVAGKPLEARDIFRGVINNRRASVALRSEAQVGRARAFLAQGQVSQAIQELESGFFSGRGATQVLYNESRAWATFLMGQAHAAKEGQENLEIAEIWYLKVAALYGYGTYPEVFQETATALADLYTRLGRKDRAGEWRRRAGASNSRGGSSTPRNGKKSSSKKSSSKKNGSKKNGKRGQSSRRKT
ncbi:MAG: tetratricopeptide repeat protein, partial [Planctomycetota bacterium]|nr:tetratricopeptide repeat protein [Planctomycetota bacterium]